ncbi:hypothetical protein ACFQ69_36560 [Streptomyces sp. NPDC056470]|uniref:hypothetical protein n=1 Tax=Streptomyces sp. NPDC056470 TaxID=3345831 RepID=UPI00369D216C
MTDTVSSKGDEGMEEIRAQSGPASEPVTRGAGVATGAIAVTCVGLGLASLTGTWAGTVLSEYRRLMGQIYASPASQQIEQIYGGAWHAVAAINGAFAFAAVLLAGLVLTGARSTAPWVRSTAWGGLALGALGLLIAGGVWFELLLELPQLPAAPTPPGG